MDFEKVEGDFYNDGYAILKGIYSDDEISLIIGMIKQLVTTNPNFRKTKDVFAIRQFLKEVPALKNIIFNERLLNVISNVFGRDYFLVKSIYFDKPEHSNWVVAWHQDITISVSGKVESEGYKAWTKRDGHYSVQPSVAMLKSNHTIRIHLDDTDKNNGALKVIPGSHLAGIVNAEKILTPTAKEVLMSVRRGGIMLMKPLILHASGRTTNNNQRRVIQLEFSNCQLPGEIRWAEFDGILQGHQG